MIVIFLAFVNVVSQSLEETQTDPPDRHLTCRQHVVHSMSVYFQDPTDPCPRLLVVDKKDTDVAFSNMPSIERLHTPRRAFVNLLLFHKKDMIMSFQVHTELKCSRQCLRSAMVMDCSQQQCGNALSRRFVVIMARCTCTDCQTNEHTDELLSFMLRHKDFLTNANSKCRTT